MAFVIVDGGHDLITDFGGIMKPSRLLAILVASLTAQVLYANTNPLDIENLLPDFYSDPTISASAGYYGDSAEVTVDPFTGKLLIAATDVYIPGNGGLSIELTRHYTSLHPYEMPEYSNIGTGWSMHYGQIRIADPARMCSRLWSVSMTGNPVFIGGDGRTRALAFVTIPASQEFGAEYVSSENDLVHCNTDGSIYMRSPKGYRYDFDEYTYDPESDYPAVWHVTRVTDRNGNYIDIDYVQSGAYGGMEKVIDSITASDGRALSFSYQGLSSSSPRLTSISYGSDTWSYTYTNGDFGDGGRRRYLSQMQNPAGLSWHYSYWPYNSAGNSGAGSMQTVTNPHGGSYQIGYGLEQFNTDSADTREHIVVTSKTRHAGANQVSSKSYAYQQSSSSAVSDTTTVQEDDGVRVFRHYGLSGATNNNVWRIGVLDRIEFTPTNGTTRVERFYWEGQQVSEENYVRHRGDGIYVPIDDRYRIPYMTGRRVEQDNVTHETTYHTFLTGGWHPAPQLHQGVLKSGPSGSRNEGITYYVNESDWIIGDIRQFSIGGRPVENHVFDSDGNIVQSYKDEVIRYFNRNSNGDITAEFVGDNDPINYSGYTRGVPSGVSYPDGGFLDRSVDAYGRITSEEDALGAEYTWSYDSIGRVTEMTPPLETPISVSWSSNSVEVTRGAYSHTRNFDGFGRVTNELIEALDGPDTTILRSYDHEDRITSQTINGSAISITYDAYGREKNITHDDGTISKTYGPGRKTVLDENGNEAEYRYAQYGDVFGGDLIEISRDGLDTIYINRLASGEIESVVQADIERIYDYYNYNQVASIYEPESGMVQYGYDDAGNVTAVFRKETESSQYGVPVYYEYDHMNRLVEKYSPIYEQNTLDEYGYIISRDYWSETFTYDLAGNMTASTRDREEEIFEFIPELGGHYLTQINNHVVGRNMVYDIASRITQEGMSINGEQFDIAYGYDIQGRLASLTLPSGEALQYQPNAYGWPTIVGSYATGVSYHATGLPSSITFGNGDVYTSQIDGLLRLSQYGVAQGAVDLMDKALAYDPVGNIAAVSDAVQSTNSVVLGYDDADQLISALGPWGNKQLTYDGLGNILTVDRNNSVSTYVYDIDNRLSAIQGDIQRTYTYPAMLFGAASSDGRNELIRDAENQIYRHFPVGQHADWTVIDYDTRDRRARTITSTGDTRYFMYGPNDKLLMEYDADTEQMREYIYLGDRLVAVRSTEPDND